MATRFQTVIENILKEHGLLDAFQNSKSFHVRLLNEPYMPLVIERHDEMISVAHYFEQNGDLIADPDVELHHPSWFPTGITQHPFGYRSKFRTINGKEYISRSFHKEVSGFLSLWAKNLNGQGWIDRSTIPHDPTNYTDGIDAWQLGYDYIMYEGEDKYPPCKCKECMESFSKGKNQAEDELRNRGDQP